MYKDMFNNSLYGNSALAQGIADLMTAYPMLTALLLVCALAMLIMAVIWLQSIVGNLFTYLDKRTTGNAVLSTDKPIVDYKALASYDIDDNKAMHLFDKGNNFNRHFNANTHKARLNNLTLKN